jgi:hypothetical protein
LQQTKQILDDIQEVSDFEIFTPNDIIEEGLIKGAVIGISGVDILSLSEKLLSVVAPLYKLAPLDIDLYSIVFIEEGKAYPRGIRIDSSLLNQVKQYYEEGIEPVEYPEPDIIVVDEGLLSTLSGIELLEIKTNRIDEAKVRLLLTLWKLSLIRKHLNFSQPIEQNWFAQLAHIYKCQIQGYLSDFVIGLEPKEYEKLLRKANKVMDQTEAYTNEDFHQDTR